jgi:hypothetical protein
MVRRLPGLLSVLILLVGLPAQAGPSPERCDRRSNLIEVEREKPVEEVALEHLNSDKTALEAMVNHKVVVDRFALMGWNRGEMGGTILLEKKGQTWEVLSSGGGWIGLQGLTDKGISRQTAQKILDQYDSNWQSYEP